MNFQQYPVTKVVEVEGATITVSINTKFITRDWTGAIKAWIVRPYVYEGWWESSASEHGITVGEAEDGGIFCVEV